MATGLAAERLLLFLVTVLLAGGLNGVAGFGFALVGTMVLATVVAPATAVVFMIVPILSVNLALVRDLSRAELQRCSRRFAPLIAAALVGTVVGLVALDSLPTAPLRLGLGLLTLGFVATQQSVVDLPGRTTIKETCFVESVPAMAGVGAVSGLVFGGTNVGVQLIAYLRSCELSHGTFVGVVALVFLGLNAVRVGAAGILGLYPNRAILLLSLAAVVPAVIGVAIGIRVQSLVSEQWRRWVVLGLLTLVGVRLILGGL